MATRKTGLVAAADETIRTIRSLLEHGYTADSFVREMMQNADDAQARRLVIEYVPGGLADAKNPLLQGPLLLVANDGAVHLGDIEALHRVSGGNKQAAAEKVGRFGLGLKSIFHWCETFLYCSASGDELHFGVVNPYVRPDGKDPVNPAWQALAKVDEKAMAATLHKCLDQKTGYANGLLFVAPLRIEAHLNRGAMRLADFQWTQNRADLPKVLAVKRQVDGSGGHAPVLPEHVLVIAQCRHLEVLEARWPKGGYRIALAPTDTQAEAGSQTAKAKNPKAAGRLGRHQPVAGKDLPNWEGEFRFKITVGELGAEPWEVEVAGRESTAPVGRELRGKPGWPMDMEECEDVPGKYENRPRKALGHGAVTLVRWPAALQARVVARWAAFLPLDVSYRPAADSGVAKEVHSDLACDLVLHGYVFLTPDRKSVYGWTAGGEESRVDSEWNREVIEQTCLPLLPAVLAQALPIANSAAVSQLRAVWNSLKSLSISPTQVTVRDVLLPELVAAIEHVAVPVAEREKFRRLGGWSEFERQQALRKALVNAAATLGVRLAVADFLVPQFAGQLPGWTAQEFDIVLAQLPDRAQATADERLAVLRCLRATFPSANALANLDNGEAPSAPALRWALRLQAAGWRPASREQLKSDPEADTYQLELLAWLDQFAVDRLSVSRGAAPAVARLARNGGLRLLLVPDGEWSGQRASEAVRRACAELLPTLVTRTQDAERADVQKDIGPASWRLLTRDLVGVVGLDRILRSPELRDLPLIPAWTPGKGGEVLLSVAELHKRAASCNVFLLSPRGDRDDEATTTIGKALQDKDRDLVTALADALPDSNPLPCVVQFAGSPIDGIGEVTLDAWRGRCWRRRSGWPKLRLNAQDCSRSWLRPTASMPRSARVRCGCWPTATRSASTTWQPCSGWSHRTRCWKWHSGPYCATAAKRGVWSPRKPRPRSGPPNSKTYGLRLHPIACFWTCCGGNLRPKPLRDCPKPSGWQSCTLRPQTVTCFSRYRYTAFWHTETRGRSSRLIPRVRFAPASTFPLKSPLA